MVPDLVVTAGGTPRVSAAQLHAGRTGGQPEYDPVRGLPAGTPSEKLDPPIPQTNLRRQPLAWQPSLLDDGSAIEFDAAFHQVRRYELAEGAWVDVVPAWCRGADQLFVRLLHGTPWAEQRTVRMYDRMVAEPRLTYRWHLGHGPGPPAELLAMAEALSARYGVAFTQVGANLYRNGADSVAWHGDRVARELPEAAVALVSLGAVRPFRLRPTGGGESVGFLPGPGDLLVMGGSCQRTWQHAVPKIRSAAPRVSIQFRHAYQR